MTPRDSVKKRKRGIALTFQGLQKLREAIAHLEDEENFGQKLTIAALSTRTRLTPDTVAKVLDGEQGVDRRTLNSFFCALNLELSENDYCSANLKQAKNRKDTISSISQTSPCQVQIHWGEAPDVSVFYGRTQELQTLEKWVLNDCCRLINILGMGGIGKSSLIAKLLYQIVKSQDGQLTFGKEFQYIIWRSLRYAPTVEETLAELIHFLSNQQEIDLPNALNQLISRLLDYLNQTRCLLILDDLETILQGGEGTGDYREGFEGYGELIQRVGRVSHNSCLIVISRERSTMSSLIGGKSYLIRALLLKGLLPQDGIKILQAEGINKSETALQALVEQYAGHPLALQTVATTINLLFSDKIDHFLEQGAIAFGGICKLLDQHFERLSNLEKTILYWLAIYREPVSLPELVGAIVPPVSSLNLMIALENLGWRSLIECNSTGLILQGIVLEYFTSRFVEQVRDELHHGTLHLFNHYALTQATAKPEIHETQTQLFLKPLTEQLTTTEEHWATLLQACRTKPHLASGYAPSNLLKLLHYFNQDLSLYDFSKLTIRQADLRGMNLKQMNFDQASFIQCKLPNSLP